MGVCSRLAFSTSLVVRFCVPYNVVMVGFGVPGVPGVGGCGGSFLGVFFTLYFDFFWSLSPDLRDNLASFLNMKLEM